MVSTVKNHMLNDTSRLTKYVKPTMAQLTLVLMAGNSRPMRMGSERSRGMGGKAGVKYVTTFHITMQKGRAKPNQNAFCRTKLGQLDPGGGAMSCWGNSIRAKGRRSYSTHCLRRAATMH